MVHPGYSALWAQETTSKLTLYRKVFAVKTDNLSSTPGTYRVEEADFRKSLTSTHLWL